jgi:hypothetical protein
MGLRAQNARAKKMAVTTGAETAITAWTWTAQGLESTRARPENARH